MSFKQVDNNEKWALIKDWEDYSISTYGRIKNNNTNKIKSTFLNNSGYSCVQLYKNGTMKHFLVHRLVAETFIPNPNNLSDVNHKNEDKLNNCIYNLEWISHQKNCQYGNRNTKSIKKNSRPIICIETGEEFLNATEIKKKYGFDNSLIHKCCKGQYKQCYGYHWIYKEDKNEL